MHVDATATQSNRQPTPETAVDYGRRINAVTAYIHSRLDGQLQLERLAGVAGFSPFHFHRIFAALMGETVAEYVRRVRLGAAVQRLLYSDEPVGDIALAVGYETPAAFTKAFRQRLGITPTALRAMEQAQALALLLKPSGDESPANRAARRDLRPLFRTLPHLRILYARGRGMVNQIFTPTADKAFATLMGYLHAQDLMHAWTACVGITPDDPNVVPPEECRFDAGVILKEGVHVEPARSADKAVDAGVDIQVLPAGRWAVFLHTGPYDTLWQTWNAVDRDWLPASGVTLRDVPPLELYVDDPRHIPPAELRTEILTPVV